MKLSRPCSIKNCHRFVEVETSVGDEVRPDEFVICGDDRNAIIVGTFASMKNEGLIDHDTLMITAKLVSAYTRRRKGVAITIRPATVGA